MFLCTVLMQMCTFFCPHDNWKQNRIHLDCHTQPRLCPAHTHTRTTRVKIPPCIQILHHNLWNSTLALTFCSFPTAALPESDTFTTSCFSFKHTRADTHAHIHVHHPPPPPPSDSFIFPLRSHSLPGGLPAPTDHLPGSMHPGRALSVFIPLLEDK